MRNITGGEAKNNSMNSVHERFRMVQTRCWIRAVKRTQRTGLITVSSLREVTNLQQNWRKLQKVLLSVERREQGKTGSKECACVGSEGLLKRLWGQGWGNRMI